MSWLELTLAFLFFFVSHSLPVRPSVKDTLRRYIGKSGFVAVYSGLSVFAVAWIIVAAGRAPYLELWPWNPWQSWITIGLMAIASVLFGLTIGKPNPFSFGGTNNEQFDPGQPGILKWTRHPLLVVLLLWSLGHVFPNGNLAHILVFATFAAFAVVGTMLIDRRKQGEMGNRWHELVAQTGNHGFSINRKNVWPFALRTIAGLLLFLVVLLLHQAVIGVSPLPL